MSGVFRVALSLSLSGSLLILTLLFLRPLVKDRFSRRWQYYIWMVALFRLLLPLTPETSLMGALFDRGTGASIPGEPATGLGTPAAPAAPSAGASAGEEAPGLLSPAARPAARQWAASALERVWIVWLAGALLLLGRRAVQYRRFARLIREGRRAAEGADTLNRLREEAGVGRRVALYVHEAVPSPLLMGILRPAIILPAGELAEEDFRYTARHELIHCRRRDLLWKRLAQAALCVHWYNPLVWRMVREMDRACELACDEAVMANLCPEERRAYGDVLLRAVGRGGIAPAAFVTLSEGAELLKERLNAIMTYKKTGKMTVFLSLVLTAALMAGATAAGACSYGGGASPAFQVKGEPSTGYRYTQEVSYQGDWLFELGWNLGEDAGKVYASRDIPLPGGGSMPLYYTDSCRESMADPEILKALQALLPKLWEEREGTAFAMTRPLLVDVAWTGGAAPADLIEPAYDKGSVSQFAAAFALLNGEGQLAWLEQCLDDGNIAFFGAAVSLLPANSPLIDPIAERCYSEGNISFFSVLTNGGMSRESMEAYLARAEAEGRSGFRSVLYTALGKDGELLEMKTELDRQLEEEYRSVGVTCEGKNYYYQGRLIRVFLDHRQDSSFYRLEMNPRGTVDICVRRDGDGAIQSVDYMTEEEVSALFGDMTEDQP